MNDKEAIEVLRRIDIKFFLCGMIEQNNYIVDEADKVNNAIETVLNLLENQKAEIEEKDKSLKLHTKLEYQYKNVIEDLKKKDKIINEYEKECRQFKAFCKRVRRDEKHDVDLFNQGQEQKCNQFLNLISEEPHWSYEGKYFDDTDNQIKQCFENKAEEENRYMEKLKINPEKDLKELEQYGFKRKYRNCYEYIREIHGETVYRVYTTPNHGYIQIEILEPLTITGSLQCLLYDLIKADLVVKE